MSKLEHIYTSAKEAEESLACLSRNIASFSGENPDNVKKYILEVTSAKRSILQVKAAIKTELDRASVNYIKNHDRYSIIRELLNGKTIDPKLVDQKEFVEAIKLLSYSSNK